MKLIKSNNQKMSHPIFFNKWWLMLVYGILLTFLSYFLFTGTGTRLSEINDYAGFVSVLTGAILINGYFLAEGNDKSMLELVCGIVSCLMGLFLLSRVSVLEQIIHAVFFLYMIMNAAILVKSAWWIKEAINWWWVTLLLLIYTMIVCSFFVVGSTPWNLSLNFYTGLQFITNGLLMSVLAFVLRKDQHEYGKTIKQLRKRKQKLTLR